MNYFRVKKGGDLFLTAHPCKPSAAWVDAGSNQANGVDRLLECYP